MLKRYNSEIKPLITITSSISKLLFEIFSQDGAQPNQVASLIENMEAEISKDCPDPKSRQYRDSSR